MSDPVTLTRARIDAGLAICEHIAEGDAPACEACQGKADKAVAGFLRAFGHGNPRYLPCRSPDGASSHIWIVPHDLNKLANAVKP
ncbi:hypothetical protein GXW78_16880 [Roseomonas terrae]|uniref:Uncharacterized protein n=1 Tax=Neoroseomonas terrae TaxID=424799 RepID=A0ABS5EK46_9PROT|nr:hypothetical protein [Neoroseomonas terrae]MBR0651350.1 hypothetical protein [Neoroseomonas terrae]